MTHPKIVTFNRNHSAKKPEEILKEWTTAYGGGNGKGIIKLNPGITKRHKNIQEANVPTLGEVVFHDSPKPKRAKPVITGESSFRDLNDRD